MTLPPPLLPEKIYHKFYARRHLTELVIGYGNRDITPEKRPFLNCYCYYQWGIGNHSFLLLIIYLESSG